MIRSDYKVCPICGAVLDPGEQCECKQPPIYNRMDINGISDSKAVLIDTNIKTVFKNPKGPIEDLRASQCSRC